MKNIPKVSNSSDGKVFGVEMGMIKVMVVPTILVMVMIIVFVLVVMPKFSEISEMAGQITTVKKRTVDIKEKITYLKSTDQKKLKEDTEFLNSSILKEKNSFLLVNIIRSLADLQSFQIQSFSISPGDVKRTDADTETRKTEKIGWANIPVTIVLAGPKEKYLDMILSVENSLPIMSVDRFEMRSATDMVELKLTISSYYIENKSTSNVGSLALSELTLTKDETNLLKRLSGFTKLEGLDNIVGSMSGQNEFVKYDRSNPFGQ